MKKNYEIKKRKKAEKWGKTAELLAGAYLMLKGYKPQGYRIKTPVGELDLIMKKNKTLAFIEVKARKKTPYLLDSISEKQKRRILKSAAYWLSKRPDLAQNTLRFDVVLVSKWIHIKHIQNAFQAETPFLQSLL